MGFKTISFRSTDFIQEEQDPDHGPTPMNEDADRTYVAQSESKGQRQAEKDVDIPERSLLSTN